MENGNGRRKLIVIIGTTGAGKTKLSIDLANALGGEVINSDVMQMYKELSIATAKVTAEEQENVPHHLLDILEPTEHCTPMRFREQAMAAIEDICQRGSVPILVGGTMYYVQSLVWEDTLLDEEHLAAEKAKIDGLNCPEEGDKLSQGLESKGEANKSGTDYTALYEKLKLVDPVMANKLHPHDVRRIRRALEVHERTGMATIKWNFHSSMVPDLTLIGVRQSELLKLQQTRRQGKTSDSSTWPPARYDTCFLWVDSALEVLDGRLDKRVDEMVVQGIVPEVETLHQKLKLSHSIVSSEDGTGEGWGVTQAIGFKEFQPYFETLNRIGDAYSADQSDIRSEPTRTNAATLEECLVTLKANTRRYARKQLRWIRNRILSQQQCPVYKFDTSDVSLWETAVRAPAEAIARAFLAGEEANKDREPCNMAVAEYGLKFCSWQKFECESCQRTLNGEHEWQVHLKSRQHRSRTARKKRRMRSSSYMEGQSEPTGKGG